MLCHLCVNNVWYYSVRLKQYYGYHTSMKILLIIKKQIKLLNQLYINNQCMKLNNGDNQQKNMLCWNACWVYSIKLIHNDMFFWISLMIVEVCIIVDV